MTERHKRKPAQSDDDTAESSADRAIREALESVERIERERVETEAAHVDDELDPDQVEVLKSSDVPPSGDPEEAAVIDDEAGPADKRHDPKDAMLEAMIKAKQEAQQILAQTQKEAKDLFERLARVSADFDNFKKRQHKEREETSKFAAERLLKDLLPTVDNLGRAVQAASAESGTLLEGVKLVLKQLEDTLARHGCAGFSVLGAPFDPNRQEAISARPDPQIPAQHVAEEYQRGYMLHDRLLRPALVIVSSGPPEPASADPQGRPNE